MYTQQQRRQMIRSYLCLNGTGWLTVEQAGAIVRGAGWDMPDVKRLDSHSYRVSDLCDALERSGVEVPAWTLVGE